MSMNRQPASRTMLSAASPAKAINASRSELIAVATLPPVTPSKRTRPRSRSLRIAHVSVDN